MGKIEREGKREKRREKEMENKKKGGERWRV